MLTYCALNYSGNNIYIIQIGVSVHTYVYSGRLLCVSLYLIIGKDIAKKVNTPKFEIWKYLERLSYWIYFWHMYIVFISVEVLKLSLTREQYFV